MYRTILVPLDGSNLAEQALTPAGEIAQKFGSELLLLRVVPPDPMLATLPYLALRTDDNYDYLVRRQMEEAEAYLASVKLPIPGGLVRYRVLAGAAPELIVATATEEPVDLIVMSTHGRTGLTRLLYGSVAEAVLRGATTPLLLVPSRIFTHEPPQAQPAPAAPNRPDAPERG
jgi:nucleotide-binding universal stress UspA family protein